jgi:ElaB/YqjD/DUF883 family membrane-anchored ribosome-binding protein
VTIMSHRENCGVCHLVVCQCPATRLRRLLRALDDDIMEMSDAEIEEELRSQGLNPVKVAEEMRVKINALLDEHAKRVKS